jgi:serine/threonine protein kinase
MGVVYRARHRRLDLPVALKMIRAHARPPLPAERARFHVEATAVAALSHPGIVRLYDYGEWQGLPYFSMELVTGGSLADRLRGGPLRPDEAARLGQTLAEALAYLHGQGVIHRDLKPGNVLLGPDGRPKVADFGLAKQLADDAGLTRTGSVLGTASYMAPEQAAGRADVGPVADVYALGAVLYEMLTGHPPFRAATRELTIVQVLTADPIPPSHRQADVPAELEAVCLRCLEKDPVRRYVDAAAVAEDLRRYLGGGRLSVESGGVLDAHARWARQAGYELIDLLGCGATGFLYRARQASLDRLVALKLLTGWSAAGSPEAELFRREAAAVARLQHPNIVQVYDYGERGGQPYCVMEFIEGGSLAGRYVDEPMPAADAASLVEALARAAHHAHQRGVVHCGLKPDSVLLAPDGTPKLTRFGLARLVGEDRPEAVRRAEGRRLASHLAPEQVEGRADAIGPTTDVYGLGALLYRLVTGQPPFRGESPGETREQVLEAEPVPPSQLTPGVPAALEAVCLRCLQKQPADRYPTALALAEALRPLRGDR